MRLTVLGIQGSGKGTQSKLLAQHFGLKRIAVGDLLRKEIKKQTKEGKILAKYMNKGEMAQNQIVNKVIAKVLPKDNFIIDGFPRDRRQLKVADKDKIDRVIFISLPKKEVYKRIQLRRKIEKRKDDEQSALDERLRLFYQESPYILAHFKDKLIKINGNQPIKKVFSEIQSKLELFLKVSN